MAIDAMNLEDIFRQVQTNTNDLHGNSPSMQVTDNRTPRREGGVHTIVARRSRAIFRFCKGRGCGHVFGLFLRGQWSPLALMLSADPLPRSRQRAWCADNAAGFRINPLPAHHLLVTLDFCAALACNKPWQRTLPTRYAGIS